MSFPIKLGETMEQKIKEIILNALQEDMPHGDITTDHLIPVSHKSKAYFIAKEKGIISGIQAVEEVFRTVGGTFELKFFVKNGEEVENKTVIATVEGDTRTILKAERVALNILQLSLIHI